MTCAVHPSDRFLATGGMDCICTIHDLDLVYKYEDEDVRKAKEKEKKKRDKEDKKKNKKKGKKEKEKGKESKKEKKRKAKSEKDDKSLQINWPHETLRGHRAYVSCIKWLDERTLITASGDKTCGLWDVERRMKIWSCRAESDLLT